MILDILFFAIIVVFAVLGFIFGLFKTLVSFFSWFISILFAYVLAKAIANAILGDTVIGWLIGDKSIYGFVYKLVPSGLKEISLDPIRQAINSGASLDAVNQAISDQTKGLMTFASSLIQNAVVKDMYLNSALDNVGQVFALELTYHIYVILVGVALFIVLRVIVMGLALIFHTRIGAHNVRLWERIAGVAAGAVRGFAYACIIIMVAGYCSGFSGKLKEEVEVSKVSMPVSSFISDTTSKLLSGNLENNDKYQRMIDMVAEMDPILSDDTTE